MSILTLLLIVLVLSLAFGTLGTRQNWGTVSWSPVGLILVVLLLLWLTGHLNGGPGLR